MGRVIPVSLVLGVLAVGLLCLDPARQRTAPLAVAVAVAGIVAGRRARRRQRSATREWLVDCGIALNVALLGFAGLMGVLLVLSAVGRGHPSSSESATIGDIRTFITAEAAYQGESGGAYGPPECLAAPALCVPGYSASLPTFLDSQMASLVPKSGYNRTFHAGAAAPSPGDGKPAPKGGLSSYAYVAVPVVVGQTGQRGFCGDWTGRICYTSDGAAPAVTDGLCDPKCSDLR